jgi:hemerythrin
MEAEHRVQLELLRGLQECLARGGEDRSQSASLLKQLLGYSEAHFLSEQLLMRLHAYPAYEEHVQEHDRLVGTLRTLSDEWAAGGGGAAGDLLRHVEGWLLAHMRTTDEALAAYLAEHGPRPR